VNEAGRWGKPIKVQDRFQALEEEEHVGKTFGEGAIFDLMGSEMEVDWGKRKENVARNAGKEGAEDKEG